MDDTQLALTKSLIKNVLKEILADRTIISLPSLPVQSGTDLKEVSTNGTGSYSETRDQDLNYINANAQISEAQVTNLETDLATLQTNIDTVQSNLTNHVDDLANPHDTSLQQAYDQSPTTAMDNGDVLFTDTNGVQQFRISTKGTAVHLPIYHLATSENINLSGNDIDTTYSNDVSGSANTINIQLETVELYADNATFIAWRNGSEFLNIISPVGVTIDGVDNSTVSLAAGQRVNFIRLSQNTWVTLTNASNDIILSWDGSVTPVNVSAGSGIDITNGVISLDGTGASAGYGYITGGPATTSVISFTTADLYFIPFASATPNLEQTNNFMSNFNTSHLGVKYTGTENCVAQITFICMIMYGTSNTNTNPNNYYMSANLNLTGGPSGSFAPINPSGGLSNSEIPFTVFPSRPTTVVFTFQIPLTPGDTVYPLVRNSGPSNTPATNAVWMTAYSFTAEKIGDVGGANAGVTSLGGQTGDIGLAGGLAIVGTELVIDEVDLITQTTGVLQINAGGTNNTSQELNGINFFNGTSIASNDVLTYDGAGILGLTHGTTTTTALYVTNTSGTDSDAYISINKSDPASNSTALVRFGSYFPASDYFALGLLAPASGNFYIYNYVTSTPSLIIGSSDNKIEINSLTASQLTATNSSQQLVSGNLTGDITSSQFATTLATVNSNVGSFGSATQVGTFTVNGKGLITAASNVTITGTVPGGSASGDLTGTYPGPTIASNAVTNAQFRQSAALSVVGNSTNSTANIADITAASNAQVLRRSGTAIGFGAIDLTSSNAVSGTLPQANGGTNATSYGASRLIFQNSGNTAFSTDPGFTFVSGLLTVATGAVSGPNITTQLNVNSSTQASARVVLSGQEFFSAGNTSTDGVAFVLGVNRSGNRQLWMCDSALAATSSSNPAFRLQINGTTLDAVATDGTTVLPISFGNTSSLTNFRGSSINLSGGDVTLATGNLIINVATKGYQQKSAAVSGGTANALLVTGVVLTAGASGTINNSAITTSHIGWATCTTSSGTQTFTRVTCGTGNFSLAGNALDTGTYAILFIKAI